MEITPPRVYRLINNRSCRVLRKKLKKFMSKKDGSFRNTIKTLDIIRRKSGNCSFSGVKLSELFYNSIELFEVNDRIDEMVYHLDERYQAFLSHENISSGSFILNQVDIDLTPTLDIMDEEMKYHLKMATLLFGEFVSPIISVNNLTHKNEWEVIRYAENPKRIIELMIGDAGRSFKEV